MTHFKLIITLCCLLAAPAQAQESSPPFMRLALNNLSHEFTTCTAYFAIVAQGLRNSNEAATAKRYDEVSANALKLALWASRKAKLKDETVVARIELEMKEMLKAIDNDTSNISILYVKHAETCNAALEEPAERLQYWIDKKGVRPN